MSMYGHLCEGPSGATERRGCWNSARVKCQFDLQTSILGTHPPTKRRVRGPIDEVVASRCVRWTDERKGERTTDLLMLSKRRQLRTTPSPDLMCSGELSSAKPPQDAHSMPYAKPVHVLTPTQP